MDKPAQNIQDSFLNNARKEKGLVTIYLLSGVKLSGRIKSFDKYSLVLETNNQEQLIFKHAISTVVTTRAIQHASPPGTTRRRGRAAPSAAGAGAARRGLSPGATTNDFSRAVSREGHPRRIRTAARRGFRRRLGIFPRTGGTGRQRGRRDCRRGLSGRGPTSTPPR